MPKDLHIPLFDLISCFSEAIDLVSPAVVNHHYQVGYIASAIGAELGLPVEEQYNLLLAGALHDIGALSLRERLEALRFEVENPIQHTLVGYALLQSFPPLSGIAPIVRFHHQPWQYGAGLEYEGVEVPIHSHIIHLADRVAVLVRKDVEILSQVDLICKVIKENSGAKFKPDMVEAFLGLARKEYFWLELVSSSIPLILAEKVSLVKIGLNTGILLSLAEFFSRIIDFRSYTGAHSSGVAACAEELARLVGFSEDECRLMKVAGYLHDLGKLAVPTEVLEKPARLSEKEFNIIKCHPFHTHRILSKVRELNQVNRWASLHHERLDGSGYPFHLKGEDIPLGSRIMALADVFSALTEDRPYRQGMNKRDTLRVLEENAANSALSPNLVSLLRSNYDQINSLRIAAQKEAAERNRELAAAIG